MTRTVIFNTADRAIHFRGWRYLWHWKTLLLFLLLLLGTMWLLFQHLPDWYRPLWLTPTQLQSARQTLEATFEQITRRLAAGETFSVTLSERQLNELLAVQSSHWPALANLLGNDLRAPCIDLQPGRIRLAAGTRWHTVQTLLTVELLVQNDVDPMRLQLLSAAAGDLPLPVSWICRTAAWQQCRNRALPTDDYSTEYSQLLDNPLLWPIPDELVWPNGQIRFAIIDTQIDDQQLTLWLQPAERLPITTRHWPDSSITGMEKSNAP
ncbi:MAG: hypothetical protein HJJLKODD_00836 [Phycisphaerae bacterium]|nr:hypothetical protein [Phycisphaerae bacterium]